MGTAAAPGADHRLIQWLQWLHQKLQPAAVLVLLAATLFHGLRLAAGESNNMVVVIAERYS